MTSRRQQKKTFQDWIFNLIPLLIIMVAGYAAFNYLFTTEPFVYDDHGFHYATLNYVLSETLPQYHRIIDWNSSWFAGIPELQFYPPGFIYIGVFIYLISLGLLSIGAIYQIVILIALFLSGLAGYFLLQRAGFPKWAALISGLILLLYPGGASGTLFGVVFGLLNSRIALGLVVLITLTYIETLINPSKNSPKLLTVLFIGILVLMHPYHLFLALIAMFSQLFAWCRIGLAEPRKDLRRAVILVSIGIGLSAFWWVPLIIHSDYMAKMQVWSAGAKFKDLIYSLSGDFTQKFFLGVYCLTGISLLYVRYTARQKSILAGLLLTPVLMLAFLFFVRIVLMGLIKFHSIDPWRLQDDFYFSIMLSSGLGIYFPLNKALEKMKMIKNPGKDYSYIIISLLVFMILMTGLITILAPSFHLKGYGKFGFVRQTRIALNLDELWEYLKNEKGGRILFTSSRSGIPGYPDIINTHVLALTPEFTGRSIIGAVNEPFYATASYFFFGELPPVVIQEEADALQNKSLLGIEWNKMDDLYFWNVCRAYNVTTVVVTDKEPQALVYFKNSSRFRLDKTIGSYSLFNVQHYQPSWVESNNRQYSPSVDNWDTHIIKIRINKANQGDMLKVKMGYFPRWKGYLNGKTITLLQDEKGLIQIKLPAGEDLMVILKYETTMAEWAGRLISILSVIWLVSLTGYYYRQKTIPV